MRAELEAVAHAREADRVDAVYTAREYDRDPEYADTNPVYLHRVQSMERATLDALRAAGLSGRLGALRILDMGCGNGRWLGRWIAWGASARNLFGCDTRAAALGAARKALPMCRFEQYVDGRIPFEDGAFDVVTQYLVFSSILSDEQRAHVAAEMARVLRPGGVLLSCDFTFNNPRNPNVRAVPVSALSSLFPGFERLHAKRTVLAPPLARRLVPVSRTLASLAESIPFLRTHAVVTLRRPGVPSSP